MRHGNKDVLVWPKFGKAWIHESTGASNEAPEWVLILLDVMNAVHVSFICYFEVFILTIKKWLLWMI